MNIKIADRMEMAHPKFHRCVGTTTGRDSYWPVSSPSRKILLSENRDALIKCTLTLSVFLFYLAIHTLI